MRAFVSFAAGADSSFLELEGTATVVVEEFPTGQRYQTTDSVWILFRQRERPEPEAVTTERMLFRYADMQFKNHLPLARWLRNAALLEPVYRLYLAALPTRALYLEFRFLAFAQALEALHFRKRRKRAYLVDVVQGFVDGLPRSLRQLVPADFAGLIRDTRHYLTHWNPKLERKAAKGDRLHAATRGLKLLLELALLQELGFGQRRIKTLVDENQRLVLDASRSWSSL